MSADGQLHKTVGTQVHEIAGNLNYHGHGLSPYWYVSKLLFDHFDGYSGEMEKEIAGETWTVNLKYQKGGIAPRLSDSINADRLYEFRIGMFGNGERKINYHIRPRFKDMRHYETGDPISSPFDRPNHPDEGVSIRFSGSNVEPAEYRDLLPESLRTLAREAGAPANVDYFQTPAESSNIDAMEVYLRIARQIAEKVTRNNGIMRRLSHLLGDQKGAKAEFKIDNTEIVGYHHTAQIGSESAGDLIPGHRLGKQIKHYHPQHVRDGEESDDPLYHPKVGVLFKKNLTGHTIPFSEAVELRRELDELLINILEWSDVPTQPDSTTFIGDKHFSGEAGPSIARYDDPTPTIEARQDALILSVMRDMTDSSARLVETVSTDGAGRDYRDVADDADISISTLYRCLSEIEGVLASDRGEIGWCSSKVAEEISAIVDSTEYVIENAADRVAKLANTSVRQASSSAFQNWMNKYAAEVAEVRDDGEMVIRIGTLLSRVKSTSRARLQDVLHEGLTAWNKQGRDAAEFRQARVRYKSSADNEEVAFVSATI